MMLGLILSQLSRNYDAGAEALAPAEQSPKHPPLMIATPKIKALKHSTRAKAKSKPKASPKNKAAVIPKANKGQAKAKAKSKAKASKDTADCKSGGSRTAVKQVSHRDDPVKRKIHSVPGLVLDPFIYHSCFHKSCAH